MALLCHAMWRSSHLITALFFLSHPLQLWIYIISHPNWNLAGASVGSFVIKGLGSWRSTHGRLSHPPPSQHEKLKRFALWWHLDLDQSFFFPLSLSGSVLLVLGPQACFSLHLRSRGFRLSVTNRASPPSPILDDFPLSGAPFLVRCIIEEAAGYSV